MQNCLVSEYAGFFCQAGSISASKIEFIELRVYIKCIYILVPSVQFSVFLCKHNAVILKLCMIVHTIMHLRVFLYIVSVFGPSSLLSFKISIKDDHNLMISMAMNPPCQLLYCPYDDSL